MRMNQKHIQKKWKLRDILASGTVLKEIILKVILQADEKTTHWHSHVKEGMREIEIVVI